MYNSSNTKLSTSLENKIMSLKTYIDTQVQDFIKPGAGNLPFGLQGAPLGRLLPIYNAYSSPSAVIEITAVKISSMSGNSLGIVEISRTSLAIDLIVHDAPTGQYLIDSTKKVAFHNCIYYIEFKNSSTTFVTEPFLATILESFCDEYQAVYDSWTIKPGNTLAAAQNVLVETLVNAGIWAKLDLFYVLAAHTNTNDEAFTNWVDPGTKDLLFSTTNHPVFAALEGFTADGTTDSYLASGWRPAIDAANYTLNDASYGVYSRSNIDEVGFECGTNSTNKIQFKLRDSNLLYSNINESAVSSVANTDSRGMYIISRTGANLNDIYKNKSLISSPDTTVTALPGGSFFICGTGQVPPPFDYSSTKQLSMFFAGASLSQSDVNILTGAFEAYMDFNGKGIIT